MKSPGVISILRMTSCFHTMGKIQTRRLGVCDVANYSPWLARCRY